MDEITEAITESIADIVPDATDVDTTVDTSVDTTPDVTPETTPSSVAATPDAAAPRPMSRSQKRITDLIEQGKTRDEEWAAKEAAWNADREKLKWAIDDPNAQGLYNGLRLMDSDPGRFVEHVLLKDERYQGLIQMRQAQAAAAEAAETPQQGKIQEPNFPEPDLQYPDGSPAHSPEVIAKYVKDVAAFATQQAKNETAGEIKNLRDLVSPFLKERADAALADKAFDQQTKNFNRITQVYGPKATELKGVMHAWCKNEWNAGRNATMQDAVEAVLVPALIREAKEAREGVLSKADNSRAQVIADTNTRAAASERTSASAGASAEETGDPIENAIRGAIRGLPK